MNEMYMEKVHNKMQHEAKKNGGRESRIQTFYKYSVGAPCSAFYVWVVETKGGIKRSF